MRKKSSRRVRLADYIAQILKNAVYEKGEQIDMIVAEAPDLPGCLTQVYHAPSGLRRRWLPGAQGAAQGCCSAALQAEEQAAGHSAGHSAGKGDHCWSACRYASSELRIITAAWSVAMCPVTRAATHPSSPSGSGARPRMLS